MVANIGYNWMPQTNAAGGFNIQSTGYVQGMMLDDPAIRYQLSGGVLAQTETLPMWGGVAINELSVPNIGVNPPDGTQGGIISRATNVTANAAGSVTGFSVFNQAYAMTITTASPVPLAASGMQVNFVRLGSNARIVVAAASSITSGNSINSQVSWDFSAQQLIPFQAAYNAATIASATYTSATGILALTFGSAPAGAAPTVGTYFNVSGLTGTGVGLPSLTGDFPLVSSASAGAVLNLQAPPGLGTITITNAVGGISAGGGALNVKVLEVLSGNSMTVSYNVATGFATWNFSGNIAVILI